MVMLLPINAADCAEEIFYSIHFASVNNLKDVNTQVNSLKEQEKMVFWEKTQAPNLGEFYRVYVGRYKSWDDALAFRKKLIKSGVVGPLGIQWFSEAVKTQSEPEPPELIVSRPPDAVQPLFSVPDKDRFVDNQDGTVTDIRTNLMWVKNGWRIDFLSAETWFDAMEKCKNFKHANFTDWRLPTIAEWQSLIDGKHQNPALVEPNPFVNIISHMPYWSTTEYTYGKDHTCNVKCPFETYTVMLYSGRILHQKKSDMAFILPVRSLETQKSNNQYSNIKPKSDSKLD